MDNEFIVSTGRVIKEYLDEYGISQKELSSRIGSSEKHISNVLNGNSRLTEEFALKLEKIIPNVAASYWLNYESRYREYIARQSEIYDLSQQNLDLVSKRFHFEEVFQGLDLSLIEQSIEMLKLLKISNYSNFDKAYNNIMVDFMEDGGEKEAIAVWLGLCFSELELQNKDLSDCDYSKKKLQESLSDFKIIAKNDNTDSSIKSCRRLCNRLGIYLVLCEPITNSKVVGALTRYKNKPAIYLSGHFKSHDHIWFAFMHEIGHLLKHYDKRDTLISIEDGRGTKEQEANEFARDFFINPVDYKEFVSNRILTKDSIKEFSKKQQILPRFLVARLQHDKIIDYS